MVEAPGTAPGSETLMSRGVYRHSRLPDATNIGASIDFLKADHLYEIGDAPYPASHGYGLLQQRPSGLGPSLGQSVRRSCAGDRHSSWQAAGGPDGSR